MHQHMYVVMEPVRTIFHKCSKEIHATARCCNRLTLQPLDGATTRHGPSVQRHSSASLSEDFYDSIRHRHPHAAELTKFPSISNPRLEIDGIYMITLEPYVPAFRF